MGIVTRILRLCRADLHGLLDQMEDRDLLLKQYLREMETALARTRTRLERRSAWEARAAHDLSLQRDKVRTMKDDIALAVARGKEDIARTLIREVHPRRQAVEALAARLRQLRDNHRAEEDAYARQVASYGKICRRAGAMASRAPSDAEALAGRQPPPGPANRPGDAEIELELIRYKEAFEAGGAS